MEIVLIVFLLFTSIMLWMQNRKLLSQLEELDRIRDDLEAEIDGLKTDEKMEKLNLEGFMVY